MFYLGATAAEMANFPDFFPKPAFMACHFSLSSAGISNIPKNLPPGSLLLLDDEAPPSGHDPARVVWELSQAAKDLGCAGVYLDFQRPGYPLLGEIAAMVEDFSCPVAVSQLYSGGNRLPVVLPPLPVDTSIKSYIAPWKGREVWMEVALSRGKLTLTKDGCREEHLFSVPRQGFREEKLHCHYEIGVRKDAAEFRLWRTFEDLQDLMRQGEALGVKHALGLFQELSGCFPG